MRGRWTIRPGSRGLTMTKHDLHGFVAGVVQEAVGALRLALRIVVFGILALVAYVWSLSVLS